MRVCVVREQRVVLEVEVALDGVPGTFDNADDFEQLIRRQVPPWYLRSVKVMRVFDAQRPLREQEEL